MFEKIAIMRRANVDHIDLKRGKIGPDCSHTVCIHVCIYFCMYVYMYVIMHVCDYACMLLCIYVIMHVCDACLCMYVFHHAKEYVMPIA